MPIVSRRYNEIFLKLLGIYCQILGMNIHVKVSLGRRVGLLLILDG